MGGLGKGGGELDTAWIVHSVHPFLGQQGTVTDEESDGALDGGGLELEGKGSSLIQIATGTGTGGSNVMPHSDFFFGDGDIDAPLDFSDYASEQNGQVSVKEY